MTKTEHKTAGEAVKDAISRKTKKRTYEVLVVDESGSMGGLVEAVVTGINEYVDAFKDTKGVRFVVAMFDWSPGVPDNVRYKIDNVKAKDVKPLTAADYKPRGGTPLYDSILQVVDYIDKMVDEEDGVDVTIFTDGMENKSEVKDPKVVAAVIERYTKRGWSFTYIGANQHAESVAAGMGMGAQGQSFNFAATAGGVRGTMRRSAGLSATYHEGGQDARLAAASSLYAATGGILPEDDEQQPRKK